MTDFYQILEKIGNLFKINLPASVKVHFIMSFDRLRKTANDLLSEQHNDSLSAIKVGGEDKWKVEEVLTIQRRQEKLEY